MALRATPQRSVGTRHTPVLREEILHFLSRPGAVLVDATVGDGGHAVALLRASGSASRLLGIDLDPNVLAVARTVLVPFGERTTLVHGTFADVARIAAAEGFPRPDGVLFDLGLHSAQLDTQRGFAFRSASALDMRFDPTGTVALPAPEHAALRRLAETHGAYTAADVLRMLPEAALAELLLQYGDERFAGRIASALVTARRRAPIRTTDELVLTVVRALPPRARHGRIHAATRTFQALRMAVNREVESLRAGLHGALGLVAPGGHIAVIAYHSGEDRIVKYAFREAAASGQASLLTKTPITPSATECAVNPRSRSAKLRVLTHTPHQ